MYYDKIRHRHSKVLAATGLTTVGFDALLIIFKYHWNEYYSHFTLEGKIRERISYNRKIYPASCDEDMQSACNSGKDTGFVGHSPDGIQICMPKRNLKERTYC